MIREVILEQGSKEWLEHRESGIGASDMPSVLNRCMYKGTPRKLWAEKCGLVEREPISPFVSAKGHEIEEKVRNHLRDKAGIDMPPSCYVRDDIFLASLDGISDEHGVLEIKYIGAKKLDDAISSGRIPPHHYIQMQMQMFVTGKRKGIWAGCDGTRIHLVHIVENIGLHREIEQEGRAFWEFVKNEQEPPISDGDTLVLTDSEAMRIAKEIELADMASNKAELKKLKEVFKTLSDHPIFMCGGVKLTTSDAGRKTIRIAN